MGPSNTSTGTLYLCSTPIGNLEDITLRVLRVLGEVDVVAAEDTRRTRKLLNHYNIKAQIVSYHQHNARTRGQEIVQRLKKGENIALVTDAGMPGIADPGTELVQEAITAGINLVPLPGPTAFATALVVSGLATDSFVFAGFPPRKGKERETFFRQLAVEERTCVIYESPHRMVATLGDLEQWVGDRWLVVTRELTKIHEEVRRGPVSQIRAHFYQKPPQGEFCLVLAGWKPEQGGSSGGEQMMAALELVEELVELGVTKKEAIRLSAREKGLSKRELYQALLAREKKI